MPTRSTMLAFGRVAASGTGLLLDVPPDVTLIVKSIYGYAYAGGAGLVNLVTSLPPAAGFATAVIPVTPDQGFRWDGWLAVDPSWRLVLYNGSGGPIDAYMSGTVLPGAAEPFGGTKPS